MNNKISEFFERYNYDYEYFELVVIKFAKFKYY